MGVIESVANTSIPSSSTGLLSATVTGKLVNVPAAQYGSQLLMLCVPLPIAPDAVQLVQVMELRLSALVAQPTKINPGRIPGTFEPTGY